MECLAAKHDSIADLEAIQLQFGSHSNGPLSMLFSNCDGTMDVSLMQAEIEDMCRSLGH